MPDTLKPNRRDFLKATAGAVSLSAISCQSVKHIEKIDGPLTFVQVGCEGKGASDMANTIGAGGKLIAVCDVDRKRAEKAAKKHKVPFYTDYRIMFETHDKEFAAAVISTPDHTHACIALNAIKRSKHVYVQKPLARTFKECQLLLEAAKKYKVVTQMGNQGHAGSGFKAWEQMQKEKAFGDIVHVNSWSNRPVWPQGMTELPPKQDAPDYLDWNNWLGPISERSYAKEYVPFKWRGWWDFGCGAIGDMAVHNMDPAFYALGLGLPSKVKATASAPTGVAYPAWSTIDFTFEKTNTGKPITVTWYDGKKGSGQNLPKMPEGSNSSLNPGSNGCMIIGSKMSAMGGSHAGRPLPIAFTGKAYDKETVKAAEKHWRNESKKLENENHHKQWVDACKAVDLEACGSKFEYAVPFVQSLLIGCVALRFPGEELTWDHAKNQFTEDKYNEFLEFTPRPGFGLS